MSKKKKRKSRTAGSPGWMIAGNLSMVTQSQADSWKVRGFYSGCAPSEVKHIDPNSGEVVTADILETLADEMLKADKKVVKAKRRKPSRVHRDAPKRDVKDKFYLSWEWKQLRFQVLKVHGRLCQCCGATAGSRDASGRPVRIVVDHIKPISKFWDLRLQRSNLQVLCDDCNMGKGAWDQTDFRVKRPIKEAAE